GKKCREEYVGQTKNRSRRERSVSENNKIDGLSKIQCGMNHNEVKLNVHASGTRVFLPANWVHLFTNGAVDRGSGATFAGGLLRDQNRDWVLGYNYYLGKCAVFEAKLWGILDGMLILLNKGYNRVMIHTDNLEVVQALQDNLLESGITVLKRVQRIMRTEKQWLI
ncbi:hypothetical protein Golob_012582, partial [Gossypium lobatum]|nr:hypothetical protein [Gossypium lobatum]